MKSFAPDSNHDDDDDDDTFIIIELNFGASKLGKERFPF